MTPTPVKIAIETIRLLTPELEYYQNRQWRHRADRCSGALDVGAVRRVDRGHYRVESFSRPMAHDVSLADLTCSCEDFSGINNRRFSLTEQVKQRTLCYHLIAAAIVSARYTVKDEDGPLAIAVQTIRILGHKIPSTGENVTTALEILNDELVVGTNEGGDVLIHDGWHGAYEIELPECVCTCLEFDEYSTCPHVFAAALWQASQGEEVCTSD